MRVTDPAVTLLMILAIGILAGVLFDRLAGPSWLARQFSGNTHQCTGDEAALLAGYHIALLLALRSGLLMSAIAAAAGAAVVLFVWRMAK